MSDTRNTSDSSRHKVRDALRVLAHAHAVRDSVRHEVRNTADVAKAKAKATAANADVRFAESKRDVERRVDTARMNATSKDK